MKLFGFVTLATVSAGLAAGWTVAFADGVARDAFHAHRLDFASLRGLGRGLFALAGGNATTKRAKQRRGFVDMVVSTALFLTLVGDGMRRQPKRTRLAMAAGIVAALSIAPLLPRRRWLLGIAIGFAGGATAAACTTRLGERKVVRAGRVGSTDRTPRGDDPSTRARLAA